MDFEEILRRVKRNAPDESGDFIYSLPDLAYDMPEIQSSDFLRRLTRNFFYTDNPENAKIYKDTILDLLTEQNVWGVLNALDASTGLNGFLSFPDIYEQRSDSRFASLLYFVAERFGTIKEKKRLPDIDGNFSRVFTKIVNLAESGLRRDAFHENFSFRYHMISNKFQAIEHALTGFQDNYSNLWETSKSIAERVDETKFSFERKASLYRKILYVGQEVYVNACRQKFHSETGKSLEEEKKEMESLKKDVFLYTKFHVSFLKKPRLRRMKIPQSWERLRAESVAMKNLSIFYAFEHPTDPTTREILSHTYSPSFLDEGKHFGGKMAHLSILKTLGARKGGEAFARRLDELAKPHMPEKIRLAAQEVLNPTRGRAAERLRAQQAVRSSFPCDI